MAIGDYGYHTLNGAEIAIDPDQRDIALPITGFNEFGFNTNIYDYMDTPILRIRGGNDGNRFTGDPAIIFGGKGDDIFLNGGIDAAMSYVNATFARSYGYAGRDGFFDTSGSTKYFGGSGNDVWTNKHVSAGSFDGDHDIVVLGAGRDIAQVHFAIQFGENGPQLANRTIELSGGKGIDMLSLSMDNVFANLTAERIVDFRDMTSGPMTLGHTTFSGFERVSIEIGDGSIAQLHGTNRPDEIVWFETDETRTEALRISGHGGNDYIVGSYDNHDEFIYGGDGADIITGSAGQGSGWNDYLFGGRGADLIYASGVGVMGTGTIDMTGDQGKDVFVLAHGSGISTVARVTDFETGKDAIALDFTFSYSMLLENPRAALTDVSEASITIQRDDDVALRFAIEITNVFDVVETQVFAYLHEFGSLRYYDAGDWVKFAVIEGAPTLTINDFQYFDYA